MTIDQLILKNFLMFAGNGLGVFDETFIDGINVFVGANATGKTTLLKCIYAACECSKEKSVEHTAKDLLGYFSTSNNARKNLKQRQNGYEPGLVQVRSGKFEYQYDVEKGLTDISKWVQGSISSVFIPTAEMLSHSKGLLAMFSKYDEIPFDYTQIDILVNAQLWETKKISERNKKILAMVGGVIDGEVVYENDIFYVVKSNGMKVEFSLEADGFKKFGLLWKLIRNGLLERGSILLWDEPEASINPELMPLLADILYILKNDGVQIFIATHNYTLAKYIDIKKQNPDDVLFLSLCKENCGIIRTARSNSYSKLKNNPIEISEEKLYETIINKSLEET